MGSGHVGHHEALPPNVPICLIVDGVFDVGDLEKPYDFIILQVPGAGRLSISQELLKRKPQLYGSMFK